MYFNTFRFHDPDVGRFTTTDPIDLMGGINFISTPQIRSHGSIRWAGRVVTMGITPIRNSWAANITKS
nr:hypothetical protein [Pseudomonas sp. FP2338]